MAYRTECAGGRGGCGRTAAEAERFFAFARGGESIGRCGECFATEAAAETSGTGERWGAELAAMAAAREQTAYETLIAAQLAAARAAQSAEERAITARYEELMFA